MSKAIAFREVETVVKTVTKTVFKVGDFVSWAQTGQLDLRPHFQRRPVWKSGAKSYLVDTVIRGLPIPIVKAFRRRGILRRLVPPSSG